MALSFVSRTNAVPVVLSSPTRYLSAAQAHAAGNLLVAVVHSANGTVVSLNNTAGDTWVKSTLSPYLTGTIHHHEVWYVLSTKGNAADVLTAIFTGESTVGFTIYELALSNPLTRQAQYVGDAAANIQVDSGTPPTITSGLLAITVPSLIVATYRDQVGPPTSPSCTQFNMLDTIGAINLWDGYQAAVGPAAVTAQAGANNTFPQWSILASAFTELGFGCPQDLPALPGGSGVGCSSDVP